MPLFELTNELAFPHPSYAEDGGLLAIGGDLSPQRLLLAYANGIFPWYNDDEPILWWSPDPRCVLFPQKFKVSKSLAKAVSKGIFSIRFDTCFADVISSCANVTRNDQDGTWITDEIQQAYIELHRLGFAHSVEAFREGKLVGGLYGISLGNAFFGESMFHIETDASKVAFVHLVEKVKSWGFSFIDNQQVTNHLLSFGAEEIPRNDFLTLLTNAIKQPTRTGKW